MQKKSFLNQLFDEESLKDSEHSRTKNCFNATGNNRSRQIRILQIGSPGIASITKKPFLTTQPIKKPAIGLFNNELIFSPNTVIKQSIMCVQSTKAGQCSQSSPHEKNQCRTISPQKNMFMAATEYVISTSPQKTRGWIARKKKVEELPKQFYRKSSQNTAMANDGDLQIEQIVSKSVNLLNKFKMIQQYHNMNNQIKSGAIIQHKPRSKAEISRKTPQQIAEQERKNKLQIKRQISQDYAKPFNPPTNITAASYIIFQPKFSENKGRKKKYYAESQLDRNEAMKESKKKYPHSHKVIASFNSRNSVEVASLTKIMTCLLALQICQKFALDARMQKILIGKFQSNIGGTSAQISEGQTYTLEDLYYGLMLPSGNDASVAIAVWGGRTLLTHEQNSNIMTHKKKQFYQRFVVEMNNKAKMLGMHKTNYANSHGLVNPQNRSCAFDLAILCEYAMENLKFRKIVSCRNYRNTIQFFTNSVSGLGLGSDKKSMKDLSRQKENDEIQQGQEKDLDSNEEQSQQAVLTMKGQKTIEWQNTHKLVQQKPKQYIGIKTGITTAAGPCLASCIKTQNGRYFIIIVLNCDKLSMRFKDTENLKKWVLQREGMSSPRKKQDKAISPRHETQQQDPFVINKQ